MDHVDCLGERDGSSRLIDEETWNTVAERFVSPNQRREKLDSFSRGISELNERWQNRFIPERENLAKAYVEGRFEIGLHGRTSRTGIERHWLIRIKPTIPELITRLADEHDELTKHRSVRRYDQLVVLVDFVQGVQSVHLAAMVRLDFIHDDILGPGEGLLYRLYSGGAFKTFPLEHERKHLVAFDDYRFGHLYKSVIKRGFEVVDGISNDERQVIWNWLSGLQDDNARSPIIVRIGSNFVEVMGGQFGYRGLQLLDVAIGPLNL